MRGATTALTRISHCATRLYSLSRSHSLPCTRGILPPVAWPAALPFSVFRSRYRTPHRSALWSVLPPSLCRKVWSLFTSAPAILVLFNRLCTPRSLNFPGKGAPDGAQAPSPKTGGIALLFYASRTFFYTHRRPNLKTSSTAGTTLRTYHCSSSQYRLRTTYRHLTSLRLHPLATPPCRCNLQAALHAVQCTGAYSPPSACWLVAIPVCKQLRGADQPRVVTCCIAHHFYQLLNR